MHRGRLTMACGPTTAKTRTSSFSVRYIHPDFVSCTGTVRANTAFRGFAIVHSPYWAQLLQDPFLGTLDQAFTNLLYVQMPRQVEEAKPLLVPSMIYQGAFYPVPTVGPAIIAAVAHFVPSGRGLFRHPCISLSVERVTLAMDDLCRVLCSGYLLWLAMPGR